ncbi:IspD/TarI family cytidylyltransferase [Oenococcus oeni]|uniref:IspD/TarI family cytidylyltransferase n=1 Tax=Oenococcus oeni TaxID=1247 RepID=UPI00050F5BBF|nr:IspD/TarI family cytidylyltransferase [Oenococcus oeni]KGI02461.1 2-C-methyl-D-erythritol 4-phosphate cytidylyltransferase [Oenococcus oeni IOEB_C52]PDH96228.1 2-C-methyl-D-erythritol 4-phosphate cytidylyltransferase [Oenococcus oeni]SYW08480.1 Ribitol-5-phosphate cytidylyltransferase [Oenococcus oeni]
MTKLHNVALIFAGGVGRRMKNGKTPKQFLEISDKPIIIYTLEIFEKNPKIDGIIVSITPGWVSYLKGLTSKFGITKVFKIVEGGKTSQLSQFYALESMRDLVDDKTIILIHDGVRPLIDDIVINNNIDCVLKYGSAITIKKAIETVVTVDGKNQIKEVMDRDLYRMAVAPQSYFYKDIFSNHLKAKQQNRSDFVDSAQLMQFFGRKLFYIEGTTNNIKITTPIDYFIFKGILEAEKVHQIFE